MADESSSELTPSILRCRDENTELRYLNGGSLVFDSF